MMLLAGMSFFLSTVISYHKTEIKSIGVQIVIAVYLQHQTANNTGGHDNVISLLFQRIFVTLYVLIMLDLYEVE